MSRNPLRIDAADPVRYNVLRVIAAALTMFDLTLAAHVARLAFG